MEWISVNDRLPDINQIVLCIGDGRFATTSRYTGVFERYINRVEGDRVMAVYFDKITHWMPLPEPPKIILEHQTEEA